MDQAPEHVDVVVVGAGFAGLRALHTFREQGMRVVVLESGAGVGGVWYWNRYPGARCDVESYDYSFGFSTELEQEWRWSERYATQPEILRYVDHVVEKFDLLRDIELQQKMTQASFDEAEGTWLVETESGRRWTGQYLIMATGQLSTTKLPQVDGIDRFGGAIYHTGRWPHEKVDFRGKRVGVIGTGSSGVQLIPMVAREAAHLTVFQRTPTYTVPANNAPISDEEDRAVKARYEERRQKARMSPNGLGIVPAKVSALDVDPEEREARYEAEYPRAGFGFALTYYDLLTNEEANKTAADFLRRKIAQKVKDPGLAGRLTPRDYPFAAKRPSVDSQYYETFNRDNVSLVDLRATPLQSLTEKGIATTENEYELDAVIFATGFDALTGSLLRPEITGRGGQTLREKWAAGPTTFLGLGTSGFPNMFVIAGPGSPSLLANVLLGIEQHVDFLAGMFRYAGTRGIRVIEADDDAEKRWVEHANEKAAQTLYPKAASYYVGAEIPGKPRVFMPYAGGHRAYRRICDQVAKRGTKDSVFSPGRRMPDVNQAREGIPTMLASVEDRRAALQARFPSWQPRALHEILDRAAEEFPDRLYVITDDRSYTYREIQRWSVRLARGLARAGVRPGEHVGLVMANYPEFVATKYAISRAGAVTIPINYLNRRDELAYVLRQSNAVALITMNSFRGLDYAAALDAIAPGWEENGGGTELPDLRKVFVFATGQAAPRPGAPSFADLDVDDPSVALPASVDPGTPADILYTSGTTGNPKGVILTHDMLGRTSYGGAYARAFEDGRRVLFSLPMYHVYGYVEGMLSVPWTGGAIIPQLTFDPAAALRGIEAHRATDVLLIPTMTMAMIEELPNASYDVSGLTAMISSGGFSPPWLWQRILDAFGPVELTTGYGMSETTATTMLTEPGGPFERTSATHGRPRPAGVAGDPALGGTLVDYRAIDPETGAPVPPGEIGELVARGPGVTSGYYKKPEETAAAFDADGWFHTGDLGTLDTRSFLRLVGRLKDVYRCGGEQVMPKEIEDLLLTHPAVLQAHVVPLRDERMGEVGVAWIVLKPEATAEPEELRNLCAERLARFKVPRHVLFIEASEVPVTPSGRPRKFLLAERAHTLLLQQQLSARPWPGAVRPAVADG